MKLIKPSKADLRAFAYARGLTTKPVQMGGVEWITETTGNYNFACPYESFMYGEFLQMVNGN